MRADDQRKTTGPPSGFGSIDRETGPSVRQRRVRRTMSSSQVLCSTVLALVVFVLVGSGDMRDSAEGMPLGWQRDVAMTVTGAIDRVVNLVSLNRPYDWAAEHLGRVQEDRDFQFPVPTTLPAAASGRSSSTSPSTSTTTTTLPALRVPTAAAPLKVVVAGDSTANSMGNRLKVAVESDPTLSVDVQGKPSTGLSRSDYFNWGARAKQLLDDGRPDVMVFMVGANDTQAVVAPDGSVVAPYGTPEWMDAYRRQVAGIMDLAHDGPRRLLWVGQPAVGNAKVNTTVQRINGIVREEAATRPWVSFFDMAPVVAGPGGGFAEYVTIDGGRTVRCFGGDSVHMSMQCLDHSMTKLVPAIQALYQQT